MAPPYMIQLCRRLFNIDQSQNLEDDTVLMDVCSNWLYQAYDHCSAILTRKPGCQKLWNKIMTLKKFIFPENATSMLSKRMPISNDLDLLTPPNCEELANQAIKDYIYYIPRYLDTVNENQCLWLILRGLLGVIAIVLCVFILAKRYNTFQSILPSEFTKPLPMQQLLLVKKNIKRILYETKYLSVLSVVDPELLMCGCPAIGLKIDAKKFCDIQAILVRTPEKENQADGDNFQKQASERLQKFFQNTGKYRLVISLDLNYDDEDEDESALQANKPVNSAIPIHKPIKRIGIRRKP